LFTVIRLMKPSSRVRTALFTLPVVALLAAGQPGIDVAEPKGGMLWMTGPYRVREAAPIREANSGRLETLLRAGQLYLTSADVVALAIENSVDVEIQRYAPCWRGRC
jgi:hypothetical protein